ncbi:MAG TPA: reverse transcriptase domain-containing protein [Candidatus Paceibacterota bacterium]|nr:reverse transcriptase domain-containing protein [Candidatus Paceibacterota bacterium]
MKTYTKLFDRIISPENLFEAWDNFKADKRNKADVMKFERNLEKNIFQLHRALKSGTYRHGRYYGFFIRDPKQRHIHKANVRDRVLHHAIFSVINPIFEETFIATSFSCRIGFGTHKGVDVLERTARMIGQNGTSDCFVLKCDVRKFFDSVNHDILITILKKRIKEEKTIWLLRSIIKSYDSAPVRERERERETARAAQKAYPLEISRRSFSQTSV